MQQGIDPVSETTPSQRREERVNLFVMAALHADRDGGPVKLRNISSIGALVEGERLPDTGSTIELRKGPLTASGSVVWRHANRAGLAFSGRTDVSYWLPNKSGQVKVDHVFQRLKDEQNSPAASVPAPLHQSQITAGDMNRVAASLDDLADALALNDHVIFHYANKLQALDIAAQLLRKLAAGETRD